MQTRGFRLTLFTVLVAIAAIGGLIVWSAQQRISALDSAERKDAARLREIAELVSALGSAQLAYSASPQTGDGWFGHVSRLVATIDARVASLWDKGSRADEPPAHLRTLLNATSAVVQATARAKENLATGSELMEADLVLAEARRSVDAMAESLREHQAAQTALVASQRAALEQRLWTVIGVVTGLWTLGFLILVLPKSTQSVPATRMETLSMAPYPAPQALTSPASPVIDLSETAELCTAISQAASAEEIRELLSKTASLIDASGVILWLRTGAESLTAVASHGYDPALITRISPIPLSVHNPTTVAWQTRSVRSVPSDHGSNAALAVPLHSPEGCIGVLAFEIAGVEADSSQQALAVVVAAQFASVISVSPASGSMDSGLAGGLQESDLPLRIAGV